MTITKDAIMTQLEDVMDPELNMSIVDLGLVYEITIKENDKIHILMTLTTMGCPLFDVIENDIRAAIEKLGVNPANISIELTFEPPWTTDRMSERAKAMLGI